jgi:hypothetical protein
MVNLMDKAMRRLARQGRCVWCGEKFRVEDTKRTMNCVVDKEGKESWVGPSCEPCAQDIRETIHDACPHIEDQGWWEVEDSEEGTIH